MKKILCIGSVTTDVIVSPADSIPTPGTLRYVDSVSTHVGGCASNAAMDLAKLGVPVALSCKVGKDNFGSFVKEIAAAVGVDVSGVVEDEAVSTTVSIVCVGSSGERSFMYNPGSTSAFVKEDITDELVDSCDIIFVAGAMLLTAFDGKPCAEFMKKCQEKGKYTVMDTAWDSEDVWLPKVQEVLPYLDLFMPSIEEASKLTGETDVNKIADRFFEMGVKNVIIKWGKHGALVCPAGEERMVLPTYLEFKPVDTTGAGDSFCAGFLAGLAQDWDYRKSGEFANAVGTHCILAIGASTGIKSIEETLKFMETHTAG
ncbi:MAG: carbohydrate kinase family protein [Clostridia bacterium]|nr:carbohydrate kinase family protein [Clostridia bacterium]